MKNQNPNQQAGGRSKDAEKKTERRRRMLRRKTKRVARKAVRLAESVAFRGAATSLRAARLVIQRIGRTDDGPRRKRINVAD